MTREMTVNDYFAIARRRYRLILVMGAVFSIIALLASYAFSAKFTSRALLQVEGQRVPAGYVKPIVTQRLGDRVATLQQHVLSRGRLRALVVRLGLAHVGKSEDTAIDEIQQNVAIIGADVGGAPLASTGSALKRRGGISDDAPGFYVEFTADNPRTAQQVCSEITSMLLQENLEIRTDVAVGTTNFLGRQVEQAKRNLDELDSKLAEFKKPHLGQLPDDVENNLKILAGLNLQLDANSQALSRAQQDKSFAESLEAQEVAAWKASQAFPELPPLKQQLIALQNQLVTLQEHYTESHPDVIKTKADIAALQLKLKQSSQENAGTVDSGPKDKLLPPEIQRLRLQIHQNEGVIERATAAQGKIEAEIQKYQGRLSLSPEVEQQYKQLTRDFETARALYATLLTNKGQAETQTEMERSQEGEQITLLNPASLPQSPSSPVRWRFAAGGLVAGLAVGVGLIFFSEFRDKSIRDEADLQAALEMPVLASVPWVASLSNRHSNGRDYHDAVRAVTGK